jgi:hypothetical protein
MTLKHRLLIALRRRWFRKEPDVYIVSFPKSGRTWLRVLLGKALVDQCQIQDDRLILETYKLSLIAGILPTKVTHDDAATMQAVRWQELESSKARYRSKKVLFLIRDPRDVAVSCFFQASQREQVYQGSLGEFLRDDRYGVRKIVTFCTIWHANRYVPREFRLLRYEDMVANPVASLAQALEFIGVRGLQEALLQRAVEFARFENMRKLEASNYFDRRMLQPAIPSHQDSYKVRKGKVGGYRDYFSAQDLAEAEKIIADQGSPFTAPYLEHKASSAA